MLDNLKDVRQKFEKTLVYYDGKAHWVGQCSESDGGNEFSLLLYTAEALNKLQGAAKPKWVKVIDPLLQYRLYNIGYLQYADATCPWLYRVPYRQYKQGLHLPSQVCSNMHEGGLVDWVSFNDKVAAMLENQYKPLEECMKSVFDDHTSTWAPHKDFALRFDRLHSDFIIEYKGIDVGSLSKDRSHRFLPETSYLHETFREEVLKVAS